MTFLTYFRFFRKETKLRSPDCAFVRIPMSWTIFIGNKSVADVETWEVLTTLNIVSEIIYGNRWGGIRMLLSHTAERKGRFMNFVIMFRFGAINDWIAGARHGKSGVDIWLTRIREFCMKYCLEVILQTYKLWTLRMFEVMSNKSDVDTILTNLAIAIK
jgi:hypothetical protein